MLELLEKQLHSRRGLVRKGAALLLQGPKQLALWLPGNCGDEQYAHRPPVLANSFPKSGTHLLDQIVTGLPGRVNYGAFLSSMTSSFQLRERSSASTTRFIRRSLPGEVVRAHLFFAPEYATALEELNFVHYFIYRDPRDVVVSASHYLRHMNPWHRLSRHFRSLPREEDGIRLLIEGLPPDQNPSLLPNLDVRFGQYEGWLSCPQAYAVRFEDLVGPGRETKLGEMVDFFAARSSAPLSREETLAAIHASIAPEKSHTFRQGKGGGWQKAFTPELKDLFKRVAGDLLIRLGYESDYSW
jgi:sulfotransferase 6B1